MPLHLRDHHHSATIVILFARAAPSSIFLAVSNQSPAFTTPNDHLPHIAIVSSLTEPCELANRRF